MDRAQYHWLPKRNSIRRGRGRAEIEIWFRIRHVTANGGNGAGGASYCEQTAEVTLGPKGAFKKRNLGVLTRRVAADRIVSALPEPRGKPKPPKKPRTPRVVELLRTAIEWQSQLEAGEVRNRADIARREGITRARVTQIMALLRLAPEIQEHIQAIPESTGRPPVSERALRPIVRLEDPNGQRRAFSALLERTN